MQFNYEQWVTDWFILSKGCKAEMSISAIVNNRRDRRKGAPPTWPGGDRASVSAVTQNR